MTGRRKLDGKISKCNEVKGVALNLTRCPSWISNRLEIIDFSRQLIKYGQHA